MWIKRQVVMLPTNEKAEIGNFIISKYDHNNHLVCGVKKQESFNMSETRQHLYITSDEQIKEGDWYLSNEALRNTDEPIWVIRKCDKITNGWLESNSNSGQGDNPNHSKKIIASTDESLSSKCNENCTNYITESCNSLCYTSFPQPSTQFINKFIEEYNKGNIITEVMVEYINNEELRNWYHENGMYNAGSETNIINELKINPKDNTISIRKIKDSWNREEIIQFADDWYDKNIMDDYLDELLDKDMSMRNLKFSESETGKKWIAENL